MSNAPIIKYSDYYIAFLDVLGFKSLVRNDEKETISKYLHIVNKEIDSHETAQNIGSIVISDSIILSIQIEKRPSQNIKKLRELCIAIQNIQFELAKINIWLRGAISSGKAYFDADNRQVVGPAYIDAYLLEERNAINPRVIVDHKLINELEISSAQDLISKVNNDESCSEEYDLLERNILFRWRQDGTPELYLKKDAALFVNYLVKAFENETILDKIIGNLEKCVYSDNSCYPKYKWVIDYLLESCLQMSHRGCNINGDIFITQHNRLQKL